MSINPPEKIPAVPDTMTYTDEERKLARQKQQEILPWYKKTSVKIAGTVLGLLGAGGAVYGVSQGGEQKSTEPSQKPVVTAPANPGEQTADAPAEPEVGVGIEGTTYETVNTSKAREFVEQALEPIPGNLSEEEAIIMSGKRKNIYLLSGTVDEGGKETVESKAEGEKILEASVGKNGTVSDGLRDARATVTTGLWYLNEIGTPSETGTYHMSYSPVEKRSDGWWIVDITVETNFYDLDPAFFQHIEESAQTQTYQKLVKPGIHKDGSYGFSEAPMN